MESLYDSAAGGDVRTLHELLQQQPFLLDRVSYTTPNNTPLHLAAMKGHLSFVKQLLAINPHLAEELNSQQSSPLHVSSSRGHVEISKSLFDAAPDMCLSRDAQGWNPIHLAAIKGHVGVLEELVPRAPVAVRETADGGLTVLHLCVKYGQLEALKFLMSKVMKLINERNDDGDTILHMAVSCKKNEIIKYLFEHTIINVNAKNSKGQTAKDIFKESKREPKNSRITRFFRTGNSRSQPEKWLSKKRDAIMVVAVLIATMAFQAGVTPPGGVWQEDQEKQILHPNGTLENVTNPYKAGEAVMAHNHPQFYKNFMRSNAVAFVSSLSTILLLVSGLPFRRPLFLWTLMVIMWLTITSVAVTYTISIMAVTPNNYREIDSLVTVTAISMCVWFGVMGILLFGNTLRLIFRCLKKVRLVVCRPKWFRNMGDENGGQGSV